MRTLLLLSLAACTSTPDVPVDTDTDTESVVYEPLPLDDVLRLHHVQSKGTHNSYHVEPATLADPSHAYTHAPLYEQLSDLGVRQLELDLHWNTVEGLQIFHLPGIDNQTTCLAFADCLAEILRFSEEHPQHLPVMVWLEPKDTPLDSLIPELATIEGHWDDIEAAILDVIPRERLYIPDDLRGDFATLPDALEANGWPTLGEVRNTVIFALLGDGDGRDAYIGDATNLADRLMFADASELDEPFAAMSKDANAERARTWADAGFLITDNVATIDETEEDNLATQAAQQAAGVHYLATDLPAPIEGRADHLDLGAAVICNPVTAPDECSTEMLEPVWD
jgi:hypothetical protein